MPGVSQNLKKLFDVLPKPEIWSESLEPGNRKEEKGRDCCAGVEFALPSTMF